MQRDLSKGRSLLSFRVHRVSGIPEMHALMKRVCLFTVGANQAEFECDCFCMIRPR